MQIHSAAQPFLVRTASTFLWCAAIVVGWRHAKDKLARTAMALASLTIPAIIYNWTYGWPGWSRNLPLHVSVIAGMAMVGIVFGTLVWSAALIRDGLRKD